MMLLGEYPEFFGMDRLPRRETLGFESVPVPGGIDLQQLSKGVDIRFKSLARLNPELLRGYTPPYGQDYSLRVPVGTSERVNRWLNRVEDRSPAVFIEYSVRFGERLKEIAQAHGVSERRLRRANRIAGIEPDTGTPIIVPRKEGTTELKGLWVFPTRD